MGRHGQSKDHDFIITTIQAVRSYVQSSPVAAQSLHDYIIRSRIRPLENVHSVALIKYLMSELNKVEEVTFQMKPLVISLETLIQSAKLDGQYFYDRIYERRK